MAVEAESIQIITTPNPVIIWVTIFVAFLNILWSLASLFVSRVLASRDKERDRLIAIDDDFWLRKIVLPVVVDPLVVFIAEMSEAYSAVKKENGSGGDAYREYLESFKGRKEKLVARMLILKSFSTDMYDEITTEMDELDDKVTTCCSIGSLGEVNAGRKEMAKGHLEREMSSALGRVVSALRVHHRTLFSRKPGSD